MIKVKTLLFNGKTKVTHLGVLKIIEFLNNQREYLHSLKTKDLIEFFQKLTEYWRKNGIAKKTKYSTNLIDFFSSKILRENLRVSLRGNLLAMDSFVELGNTKYLYHAQPRGLCAQWLAGNTPIIGVFSVLTSTISKNVTLAKASSKGYKDLVYLISTISEVKTGKIKGSDLIKTIAVVLIDRADSEAQDAISLAADTRVAWGSKEAIDTISKLPKQLFCEDIIMGPKYSLALIDNASLRKSFSQIAQRTAIDVSVFDQYACSSPHTLFVEEKKKGEALNFAKELSKKLDLVERTLLPKGKIGPGTATEILEARSFYELKGRVFISKGTKWTVLYDESEKELFKGCFGRVIMVKPIKNVAEVANYIDRQKQTLGVAMTTENKLKFLDKITTRGIERCPNLGYMTFYEIPWDGMFIFDRLVRWVTIHKNEN